MKLAFIGLGLLVLLIGLLEYQRWITVNWSIVKNQTSVLMTHAANKIATITQHMNHEIPIGWAFWDLHPEFFLDSIRARARRRRNDIRLESVGTVV